ncbi:diguanylate cyclase (GGDEF)-like protein [Actinoplanes octamycinicus]|uniref:Diguanylate cyclase (GGDEF)-like protein n=1 Tax=Actinoplanes octamycinicus TaxID=135948 RepID=A0A7W7H3M3_9ACTN|nr:GGDEF domain-containing protein [Actinoplanes octamycinicus]MBB4743032.1 diguanylate cyclase (GGDEF)-like protein [Actinoplanes octamycinicus]GIE58113.1 hypothetical protein Aoc01nite_35150 [Actinoplanes octamycinicus]
MRRLLPPKDLGRRIQWLFLFMSLINVVTSLPRMISGGQATTAQRAAAAVAIVFLVGWWVRGYRRQRVPVWGLPLEALALGTLAVGQHDYVATLGMLFSSMSFRGLFGTWRQVAAFVVTAYAGTVSGVLLTAPGDLGPFLVQSMGVPALAVFTSLVALSTRRQEESNARERIFAQVGTAIGTTSAPEDIHRTAVDAALGMLGPDSAGWAAIQLPDGTTAAEAGVPGAAGQTAEFPLEADKRRYGKLVVHGTRAELRAAHNSLRALAGQIVLGLVNAGHAADLRHQAYHDALTGLANRALLREHLDRAVERARQGAPLAVLLIDLDGFKGVNDTHGHATGDFLLVSVAQRLREAVRGADTPARLGGDEFAVVLEGMLTAEDGSCVADRILAAIQAPLYSGPVDVTPRASIGLAIFDGHASSDALLHEADTAMYAAKRAGKGCVARLDATGRPVIHHANSVSVG